MSESKCVKIYIALTILAYFKFKIHTNSIIKKKSTSSESRKKKELEIVTIKIIHKDYSQEVK